MLCGFIKKTIYSAECNLHVTWNKTAHLKIKQCIFGELKCVQSVELELDVFTHIFYMFLWDHSQAADTE